MTEQPIYTSCFLCKKNCQVSHHIYEGRQVPAWGIFICDGCRSANWDGIVPSTYPHLIEYLKSRGVPVDLNEKGWLNIPQ